MKRFLTLVSRGLSSVRLTVFVLVVLTAVLAAGSAVPQGLPAGYYDEAFGDLPGILIVVLGLHRFTRSFVFLVPAGLFIVNLFVCTLKALLLHLKLRYTLSSFGTDLVHTGLLVLVTGSLLTALGAREWSDYFLTGDVVLFGDGSSFTVTAARKADYPDGSARDWFVDYSVKSPDGIERMGTLRVNRPGKWGGQNISLVSYFTGEVREYRDGGNNTYRTISETAGPDTAAENGFTLVGRREETVIGLRFAVDPGYAVVVLSFVLLGIGLILRFFKQAGRLWK